MARAFRWEGDAAVAHLDEVELAAVADGALAVIAILGGGEALGVDTDHTGTLGWLHGDADAGSASQDDIDARFAALTADVSMADPQDEPDGGGWAAGAVEQDSALARLLPPAHTSDPQAAADFAAMAHDGIRATKVANLTVLVRVCERSQESGVMALDPAEARKVMAALTDVRLVLADRLGIHEDGDAEEVEHRTEELIHAIERGERLDEEEEIVLQLGLHHGFLGWLQETLVEALLRH